MSGGASGAELGNALRTMATRIRPRHAREAIAIRGQLFARNGLELERLGGFGQGKSDPLAEPGETTQASGGMSDDEHPERHRPTDRQRKTRHQPLLASECVAERLASRHPGECGSRQPQGRE